MDSDVYVWAASCLSGERRGKQFLLTIRYPFLRPPLPPSEVSPTCTVASSTEVVRQVTTMKAEEAELVEAGQSRQQLPARPDILPETSQFEFLTESKEHRRG